MNKTTIRLTETNQKALSSISDSTGRPQNQIINEAIDFYTRDIPVLRENLTIALKDRNEEIIQLAMTGMDRWFENGGREKIIALLVAFCHPEISTVEKKDK
jgi:predicted DNA-binding protein